MDYKYIKQLLERYFACETSLEEEAILRSFFAQKDVPQELAAYKSLFAYEVLSKEEDVLGDDFDEKILDKIDKQITVKARVIPLRQRLRPLWKAAAVVAIFLTLGNAAQMASDTDDATAPATTTVRALGGSSVAMGDSAMIDTLQQQSSVDPATVTRNQDNATLLK